MLRYQTESQAALGAASASPIAPKGCVSPRGSKSDSRPERSQMASAASATLQIARRLVHTARQAIAAPSPRRGRGISSAPIALVRSRGMPVQVATLGTHQDKWIAAILSIVLALVAAWLVDRLLSRRGRTLAAALAGGTITPTVDTRLRFVRRMLEATIIFVGVFVAISQFDALEGLAQSVLTSSAIVAATIGLASRTTLANGVAGILLAITQPLRVGDQVTFEGESGTVEDVRLTYTYLRDARGTRVVIPNERLAMGMLRNHTVLQPDPGTEVSVWLAPETDALRAVSVLEGALPEAKPVLAEVAADGSRLTVTGEASRENELRASAYAALRGAGLR